MPLKIIRYTEHVCPTVKVRGNCWAFEQQFKLIDHIHDFFFKKKKKSPHIKHD